jgi:flagellar biosynthetic protein FliP
VSLSSQLLTTNCLARGRTDTPRAARTPRSRRWLILAAIVLACFCLLNPARGQQVPTVLPEFETVPVSAPAAETSGETSGETPAIDVSGLMTGGPDLLTSPEGLSGTLQIMLLLTVVSLAPAILLMTTSFVRILVVLGLLRQALGTQQLPPNQVITSLTLFMTLLIMTPVWKQVYDESIQPYTDPNVEMSVAEAWEAGVRPVRRFMSQQIELAGNSDDVWLFYEHLGHPEDTPAPENYDDVPLQVLLPAFMLSELKTAFLIGFQIYLPFLILDIVIASVTISMGMLMLPPVMISLPFKILLFVLVDGWHLVVGMLLESFAPFT